MKEVSAFQVPAELSKPGLLQGSSIYILVGIMIGVIISALILIGVVGKKNKDSIVEKSNRV